MQTVFDDATDAEKLDAVLLHAIHDMLTREGKLSRGMTTREILALMSTNEGRDKYPSLAITLSLLGGKSKQPDAAGRANV